jgi:hypothetical protein
MDETSIDATTTGPELVARPIPAIKLALKIYQR